MLDNPPVITLCDDFMRTIVEIPEAQLKSLSQLCRRERISRAEAIRRAVAKMLNDQRPMEDGMSGAFGIWKHRAGDVRGTLDQLRGEWR
jgi:metal-responsive CopG/Arc/MetJ family transcriptional regulator